MVKLAKTSWKKSTLPPAVVTVPLATVSFTNEYAARAHAMLPLRKTVCTSSGVGCPQLSRVVEGEVAEEGEEVGEEEVGESEEEEEEEEPEEEEMGIARPKPRCEWEK